MKAAVLAVVVAAMPFAARAATQEDAQAAVAQAERTEAQATRDNRWTPAEDALKAAHDAIHKQDWDAALAAANRGDALARRAVEQSKDQETHWRDAVVR